MAVGGISASEVIAILKEKANKNTPACSGKWAFNISALKFGEAFGITNRYYDVGIIHRPGGEQGWSYNRLLFSNHLLFSHSAITKEWNEVTVFS